MYENDGWYGTERRNERTDGMAIGTAVGGRESGGVSVGIDSDE